MENSRLQNSPEVPAGKRAYLLLPPLFYLSVAMAGSFFTARGVTDWYPELIKPIYTPHGSIIGAIWTAIYVLCTASLMIFVVRGRGKAHFSTTLVFYVFNGIANAAWSYLFFTRHWIGYSVIDSAVIGITVAIIMILSWRSSRISALLLAPYLAWVCFATYLAYEIYRLN